MIINTLKDLDKYKNSQLPIGYPDTSRTFYSPVDDVHGVLLALMSSAQHSLVLAMYGFDDDELANILVDKLNNSHLYVQLTLDKSQAGGKHEKTILAKCNFTGNSISIGSSEKSRIQHMKMLIIDGLWVITGSTNWSLGAETLQDNQLTVLQDALIAAEARSRIDIIHDHQLKVAYGKNNAGFPHATPSPGA